jgi:crotonobetainyl-CoA:carnitine CoA-transferase CaiB-like acyl-CoA transferase
VVVEGFRPGMAGRLGAGYDQLSAVNPALVYCSISGFGQTGPLAHATGHDHNYQAYAGAFVAPPAGGPPMPAGALIGDQGSGMAAAFAILAAVLCARRTGEGEHIDVSIADLMVSWTAPMGVIDESRHAARPSGSSSLSVYETGDGGHVVLGIFSEDHFWDLLCRQLGLEQYVGLGMADRSERAAELRAVLQAAFASRTRDDLVAELDAVGVPVAPVLTRTEALDHPHFLARGVIARGPQGDRRVAHPIAYRRHPPRAPGLPPSLGEGGDQGFD